MKKRVSEKYWIPFWVDKWIWGSMRIECTVEERSVWIDLLALGAKDDGWIRANEDIPYPLEQLAGMLRIPVDKLKKAINKFVRLKKLTRFPNKTLYITEWKKYQFTDRHKRRVMSAETDIESSETDTIEKNRIEQNKKEEENNMYEEEFEKLWKSYPKEGRFKKDYCLKKFKVLCKAKKLDEFRKTTQGYASFLDYKKNVENFPQKPMHLSTWLNNWEGEKEQYIGFKYEPPL